jgi:hypothetical protein
MKQLVISAALPVTMGLLAMACVVAPESSEEPVDRQYDEITAVGKPTGKGGGTLFSPPAAPQVSASSASAFAGTNNGIGYGGGPVMASGVNVYLIWYGNWANNSATTIIPDWASNIGESPYFNINTSYSDSSGNFVKNVVSYAGATSDAYSRGGSLNDGDIQTIVAGAINGGKLPVDPKGVYFVLTSTDVQKDGFCTQYCGWHTYANIAGAKIKYSFVGNADKCGGSCGGLGTTPNGNAGVDDMISVMTHELEETATDPELNAWGDANGENADKCAWNFGAQYTTSNGGKANMKLGGRDYLIQQNWLNDGGGRCALSYNPAVPFGAPVSINARADLRYVSAESAGASALLADRDAVGTWERFQLVNLGGGNVAIKALINGQYVCADNAGNSPLIANRAAVGAWETFKYIDLGNGYFALQAAANGKYVTADNAGSSALIANRTAIGAWEKFHWDAR